MKFPIYASAGDLTSDDSNLRYATCYGADREDIAIELARRANAYDILRDNLKYALNTLEDINSSLASLPREISELYNVLKHYP